ncbi:MAG: metalloregulator ArsR/SmtB family transcription factor [Pseudomonadota bacterium]
MVEYSAPDPTQLDAVFGALADPTRRAMLRQLKQGPRSVGELGAPHDMSFAGAAKHVKRLEQASLVTRERRGRQQMCRLNPEPLADAQRWLEQYAAFWTERLHALETLLTAADDDQGAPDDRHTE